MVRDLAAASPEESVLRCARVDVSVLPRDLLDPEGKTRWDLTGVRKGERFTRTSSAGPGSGRTRDEAAGPVSTWVFRDPAGGDGAMRLLRPDLVPHALAPGTRVQFLVDGTPEDGAARGPSRGPATRLLVTSEILGVGWAHLPSGPREVALERLLVLRSDPAGAGFVPDRLSHRFIDPRIGVVAEISGPVMGDGRARLRVADAFVVEEVLAGAADLRLYVSDLWSAPQTDVLYSRDRAAVDNASCTGSGNPLPCCSGPRAGACTPVSTFSPVPVTSIGDLAALSTWDFSGITTGAEVGATTAPMNAQETCNIAQCGYTEAGAVLDRTDRSFDVPANLDKINASLVLENRASDTVIWLRAGSQHEGLAGSLGSGESRFCYVTFGGVTRTPAPLWQLRHQDTPGAERYMLPGDFWSSAVCVGGANAGRYCTTAADCPSGTCPGFNCEQNVFNQVCGASQLFDKLYTKACDPSGADPLHSGTQSGIAIKNGVVMLPTGHTFNAMLVRNAADFCVWVGSGCTAGFQSQAVRTVNYLWQVPVIGTVARIQSAINAPDLTSWTAVAEGLVAFGLFPPLSIQVTATGDTTVNLSWNPGLDTHRITGYKVYWDTDSGAGSSYAFNSAANPGQAVIAGTTAVISGLTPGTTYYFTVTSLSSFTSPSSNVTTSYESPLYPTQISGDPDHVYPVEVSAMTTGGACLPTAEVTGVTVSHATGGDITICWDTANDPCLQGYRVLGASTPESAANYSTVADTDLSTCWTGNPSSRFFLIVARGTGGIGPWGHYGQ
jgi:hypothetical protein